MTFTTREAVEKFVQISGQELWDDIDLIERDIGDPKSMLPITKTHETVDDFKAAGWEQDGEDEGIICMQKPGFEKSGPWLYIADMGDHRLVYKQN